MTDPQLLAVLDDLFNSVEYLLTRIRVTARQIQLDVVSARDKAVAGQTAIARHRLRSNGEQ